MEFVKLIRDIVIEVLPASSDYVEIEKFGPMPINLGDGMMAATDLEIERQILPVHTFFKTEGNQTKRTYIAITEDIQEFLGVPFDAMKSEQAELNNTITHLKEALQTKQKELNEANREIDIITTRVKQLNELSFLGKIRLLFCNKILQEVCNEIHKRN